MTPPKDPTIPEALPADTTLDSLHQAYKANPTPQTLTAVVNALHPTINYSLSAVNALHDPVVKSKALVYAAHAVQKYSPEYGASLPTFVSSQLRQLSRTARQSRSVVKIPERTQLDNWNLVKAERVFQDKHGRDPDLLELSDATGLSPKSIERIRKFSYVVPSESALPDFEGDANGPDFQREAMDYAYHEADYMDRKILEMKTGYGGKPVMQPKDIAVALNLTPSQLSRRSAKLSLKINDLEKSLREI